MKLIDLIPDADVLYALEPEELGLRMLPALASWGQSATMQQLTLEAFLMHVAPRNNQETRGQYPPRHRLHVEQAICEAWAWLEGAALLIKHSSYMEPNPVRMLSRRAHQLADEPNAKKVFAARSMPKETLHASIREDVWALYHRGKYDTAVFEAMKAVEVAVRVASKMPDTLLGVRLMRAALAPVPNAGPLTDVNVDTGEQVARMELFTGAIGSYKNPHSHHKRALDDPDEAADIIMLANHLLRIVDGRCAAVTADS